ncbi:restriction endonuclease subunit S [Enterococcus faecium]|uniref:restriction endonuclease subunit S n=1 Tax=Enterococcus faecium TaxID=1352 RepID=UPI00190EA249|nr:restriction endonuclease subunit S [Enterococcus faecium]
MSKNSPQLRFEGFTDAWEERKLGEIFNYEQPTKYIVKSTEYDDNFNTPVLTAGKSFLLGYTDEISGIKNATVENPVVIFDDFTTGSHYVDFPFKIKSSAMKLLSLNDNSDNFYFMFNTLKNIKYVPQSHERHWISKFSSFEIYKPSQEEQQKIGAFFKKIDDTIALHQRKLDLLKEQKKGYLQKMFPKNGAKVPELRFAGFADDWEERKLSGIIEKLSGGASIKPTDYLEDGIRTIPKGAVNATGIADLSGSKYISEDFFEKNITSHAHTSNLVTSLRDLVPSAPNMGRIVRIEGDDEQFLMPQGVYKLELFEGMDEDFLISFSNSDKYRKIISAEKNGSTQVHIRNGEFLNIDINLPSEHEQKKIGSFFKQLDNTIALHQRKLDLLKEQKKGFLQKMFV